MARKITTTPLMKQYDEMKQRHPDAIILFRVGDFYETFADDARACADILGITLTRRANGVHDSVYLAGFPHHALDTYLPKLVRAGRRVAICEELKSAPSELINPAKSMCNAIQAVKNAAANFNGKTVKVKQLTIDFDF